jgi:predicted nucleotidyltransferase
VALHIWFGGWTASTPPPAAPIPTRKAKADSEQADQPVNSRHCSIKEKQVIDMETIQAAAIRLANAASSPSRVILFGSYGRGTADEGSDLDFMVIEQELTDKAAEYVRLRRAIGGIGTGVDLLIYPLAEFERRSQVPGTVLFEARIEGKILYDALH